MKRILVLGAGLVSRPLIHYLTDVKDFEVQVATRTVSKAESLVAGRPRGRAIALNVKDEAALEKLIAGCDLAVSLLPATEHVKVATLCLKHSKHMATTSYISPAMKELGPAVKAAGLTFMNECGVDPGIDHMSAMRVFDDGARRGAKLLSFRSYCGGLPAPEANTNPIGYKFSWAPRGVLVAATNAARYLRDGELIEIPGDALFAAPEIVEVPGVGRFEGYPNRDSLPYMDLYGIKEIRTMFRGTLRNLGHCASWLHFVRLGLFDQTPRPELEGMTYRRFMEGIAGDKDIPAGLARKAGTSKDAPFISKLEWLGLFQDEPIGIAEGGNVDVMAARMLGKCFFAENERDLLALQHEFVFEHKGRTERSYSTLVAFGIPGGDSAMARTVSLPCAIAVRMILEGRLAERGVIAPVMPAAYDPILDELASLGIRCEERAG